jgi:hypothetical protein
MSTSLSFTAPRVEVKEWERELESMPMDEKAKAIQDLYGRTEPIEETPEFLLSKMEELQVHLQQIGDDTEAFLEAQRRLPGVVNSFEFRLMFLRAGLFDAEVSNNTILMDESTAFLSRSSNLDLCQHVCRLGDSSISS